MLYYESPYHECALKAVCNESRLVFLSASPEFFRLIEISYNAIGSAIEDVIPKKNSDWIYRAFDYLKQGRSGIMALREIGGYFWSYELSYNAPILTIKMHLVWNKKQVDNLYSMNNISVIPVKDFFGSYKESILLEKTSSGYYIKSISNNASKLFEVFENDNILTFISHLHCINSCNVFDRSLEQNCILHLADVFSFSDKDLYLMLSIIPLNHEKKFISLNIHQLEQKDFFKLIGSLNIEKVPRSKSNVLGVAVFQIENEASYTLLNHNCAFDNLLRSDQDFSFIHKIVIPQCLYNHDIVTINHKFGDCNCVAIAIPTISDDKVFVFVMPHSDTAKPLGFLESKLTKREYEIAHHLFTGNSIRSIAVDCGISEGTVKKTMSNIYAKLNIGTRVELVRMVFLHNSNLEGQ